MSANRTKQRQRARRPGEAAPTGSGPGPRGRPAPPSGRGPGGSRTARAAAGPAGFRLSPRIALAVVAVVVVAVGLYAWREHRSSGAGGALASTHGAPVYQVVEGQAGYDYPYDPQVLHVKAGHPFDIRLVDHLGGCGLDTMFPGLGQGGATAVVNVPVGATRTLTLEAPHPGTYVYHCGGGMYFAKIVAT